MEALHAVPVALAAAVGKGAHHAASGVEAHQVGACSVRGHGRDHLLRRGQAAAGAALGVHHGIGQQQVGVVRYQRQLRQQGGAFGQQGGGVGSQVAAQTDAAGRPLQARHHADGAVALLYMRGLAHLGVVEADEIGGFGSEVQGDAVGPRQRCADGGGEVLKVALHQAAPPNTDTALNRQAGDAWPTRITWLGSPLPQYGVPMTCTVLASPTIASERQNPADRPR